MYAIVSSSAPRSDLHGQWQVGADASIVDGISPSRVIPLQITLTLLLLGQRRASGLLCPARGQRRPGSGVRLVPRSQTACLARPHRRPAQDDRRTKLVSGDCAAQLARLTQHSVLTPSPGKLRCPAGPRRSAPFVLVKGLAPRGSLSLDSQKHIVARLFHCLPCWPIVQRLRRRVLRRRTVMSCPGGRRRIARIRGARSGSERECRFRLANVDDVGQAGLHCL